MTLLLCGCETIITFVVEFKNLQVVYCDFAVVWLWDHNHVLVVIKILQEFYCELAVVLVDRP